LAASLGTLWLRGNNSVKSSLYPVMDWNISGLEEFQESDFGTITYWNVFSTTHLDVSLVVVKDTFLDEFQGVFTELTVEESVFSVVIKCTQFTEEPLHLHLILGQN